MEKKERYMYVVGVGGEATLTSGLVDRTSTDHSGLLVIVRVQHFLNQASRGL